MTTNADYGAGRAREHAPMTKPQRALLDELSEKGLYIKRYSRWWRTVEALKRRGLVRIDEPDYGPNGMDHWVVASPTDGGET